MRIFIVLILCLCLGKPFAAFGAYNLEVPVDPWDEYRQLFKNYSRLLLKSYDKAFVNDYEAAAKEATKAIELLPDEGLAYAERAYYQRMMNNHVAADTDFRLALTMFSRTLERYRPAKKPKKNDRKSRQLDPSATAHLIATTHYQRGEVYYRFEQYQLALTDFSLACQGGEALACAKMWETKQIEKRGAQWVPVANRQFYDKQRVDTASVPGSVRVWLRREDAPVLQADEMLQGSALQQHLELRCASGEYRILEGFSRITGDQVVFEELYRKPVPGSAVSKLLYMYCRDEKRK